MTEVADVAIVGYGPVGSALAILLGQQGHRVVVLERWPEPYPLPRAVHLDHEVARILQGCGLGGVLEEITEAAEVYEWRNGDGVPLLRIGRRGDSDSAWPESLMFNQPSLEAALDERARSLPTVEVRRGVEVVGLAQDDAGVTVEVADGPPVRARHVVGCDGANSTVRRLVEAPVHDMGFFYDWLVVDVILHEARTFDPLNVQICDPARPTTAVSGGPGRRRWEFMRLPDEPVEDLDTDERCWELLAPWDVHPGNAHLERHCLYTFHARHCERWRTGRVLLAGDAAHQTPPFAGQGMCAGIRDAANLAWKLDLVLRGHAADDLLDAYQEERLAPTIRVIELAMELGRIICVPDPAEAAARDELMAPAVGTDPTPAPPMPVIDRGVVVAGTPGAGELFVQGRVDGARTDDVCGHGWLLATAEPDGSALGGDEVAWFRGIGGRVAVLDDDATVRWFDRTGATWALRRPDFQVAGSATDADGAVALLGQLRALLGAPTLSPTTAPGGTAP